MTDAEKREAARERSRRYYERHKDDPEFAERRRRINQASRDRLRQDPEWMARKRERERRYKARKRATDPQWVENNRRLVREWARKKRETPEYRAMERQGKADFRLRGSDNQDRLLAFRENRERFWKQGKQRCLTCWKVKPLDTFHFQPDKQCACGYRCSCRDCLNERNRGYRARAKDRREEVA